MTTWQDQQPTSRRALRESERAQDQTTMSDVSDEPAVASEQTDFGQQIWQQEPTDAPHLAPPATQVSSAPEEPLRRPRGSGSQRPEAEQSTPESQAYRLRDFSPENRGASFSSTQSAPWTPPAPGSEDLGYQTSGRGHRAGPTDSSTPVAPPPMVVTPESAPSAPDVATDVISHDVPTEHTLTRRELRELRNAAGGRAAGHGERDDDTPNYDNPERLSPTSVTPELALKEPMVSEAIVAEPVVAEPVVAEPVEAAPAFAEPAFAEPASAEPAFAASEVVDSVLPEPVLLEPALPEPVLSEAAPVDELAAAMAEFDKMFQAEMAHEQQIPALVEPPSPSAEPVAPQEYSAQPPASASQPEPSQPEPSQPEPSLQPESAHQQAPIPGSAPSAPEVPPAEPLREVVTAPEVYSTPESHWSAHAAMGEALESSGRPHKRDIAASDAITTSALILPDFPVSMPITGPVSGTGEILMTGSIALPRSMGARGVHPSRYDGSDVDDLSDGADREDAAPDSAPVRAVRAVSTYTSSQGIINARRPKGNNLTMVLMITAGVSMVAVLVLVVAAMVFKVF